MIRQILWHELIFGKCFFSIKKKQTNKILLSVYNIHRLFCLFWVKFDFSGEKWQRCVCKINKNKYNKKLNCIQNLMCIIIGNEAIAAPCKHNQYNQHECDGRLLRIVLNTWNTRVWISNYGSYCIRKCIFSQPHESHRWWWPVENQVAIYKTFLYNECKSIKENWKQMSMLFYTIFIIIFFSRIIYLIYD